MNDHVRFGDDATADMTGQGAGMAKRCFYEVLEVERAASDGELKAAFRKLAMKWHPDRNPNDTTSEHRFKEINEAYEVLKDGDKRAAYDRFGHAAFEHGGPGAAGFGNDFGSAVSRPFAGHFAARAALFEGIFGMGGGGRGRTGRERGADLRYNMEISLEEAYAGKTAQVRIPASISCSECSGRGAKPGPQPVTCSMCNGHGKVRATQGFFSIERTCPQCQGRGQTIKDPCPKCAGH